jgi:UDP:flavonoid glycosyltransferase YjiC (YdhE family)
MRVLIAATGSYGDIYPFVAIGREMKRRGHDVRFFSSAYFAPLAREHGLSAFGIGPVEAYENAIRNPNAFDPWKGFGLVADASLQYVAEAYRVMDEQVSPGDSVVIASTLSFAARLFQETRQVPTVAMHVAPVIFRSASKPARFLSSSLPPLPPVANRLLFWFADKLVVDPLFCPRFNRLRADLGLPPIRRMFGDWMHSSDLVVGLFPEWFGPPQPEWPRNLRLTSFPLYDGSGTEGLEEGASAFLAQAKRPVLFTAGTAATSAASFFAESVEACRIADLSGLLVTRYPEQIPRLLPPNVRHFQYLPFSVALPRVTAVVHHGGIGTTSQALRAGTPQLVRPFAFDQFDNARRLEELGVARWFPAKKYRARAVAEALLELTKSDAVRIAVLACKARLASDGGQDGVSSTCDVVLNLMARQAGAGR